MSKSKAATEAAVCGACGLELTQENLRNYPDCPPKRNDASKIEQVKSLCHRWSYDSDPSVSAQWIANEVLRILEKN